MEAEHVEHVKPSSSRDHIRRDRPVESEEEESNKLRLSDPTGQKRKEFEVMTENQSRAKAKAADPAGSKSEPSKVAEGTPVKAKMADPTGEKRKADSDAEDEEAQGSPMRSRVEDEDMLNRLSRVTSFEVLQLHAGSNLTRDSEKHGIDKMYPGGGAWILTNWEIERGLQLGCEK